MTGLSKIILCGLSFFLFGLFVGYAIPLPEQSSLLSTKVSTSTISIMFDYGDDGISVFHDISIKEGDSMFDVLFDMSESDKLTLEYTDYGLGMGVMIMSIDNYTNGNPRGTYWQYWVNNKYAKVGASNFKVNNNDVIEWKFTKELLKN